MCIKAFLGFMQVSLTIFLVVLNSECLCAPINRITRSKTNPKPSANLTHTAGKAGLDITLSKESSDLTIVYLPLNPGFSRLGGISVFDLLHLLNEFRATGNTHPDGLGSFAAIIQSQTQQASLIGLLDSKGRPIKSSDGDAEILLTQQAWNKSYVIDQYGAVIEIFDQSSIPADAKIGYNLKYAWRYKLTPLEFQRLHEMMGQIFPQSLQYVTFSRIGKKP